MAKQNECSKPPNQLTTESSHAQTSIQVDERVEWTVTTQNEETLKRIFASQDKDLALGFMRQIINSTNSKTDPNGPTDMVAFVSELKPRDAVEAALAVQMGIVQSAISRASRRLSYADNLMQCEAHDRALNRLARTYAAQIEALRKHRNKGEQKIVTPHVNVEGGGQAIVGNVEAVRGR